MITEDNLLNYLNRIKKLSYNIVKVSHVEIIDDVIKCYAIIVWDYDERRKFIVEYIKCSDFEEYMRTKKLKTIL